ncbi:LOW QUALITY PROTEIN: zinc finger protein 184-like [Stylophora pistillata]|uniref:LOW QUALITY PROTEIN: zinc finger protein 184-like n=1 Tax=Stylophora pistillata TaxID=50429 RepID=UPI000C042348|nr:LOW QUALITY PROTEIN: zinc finger protein 184-like [Stylophora pistillata]
MEFPNGVVVARPPTFQIQRQDICEEKISYKRQPREPAVVKTVPNNQQSTVNFPNGIVVARPLNFQIQRQDICEEKISYKRQPREPAEVKTVPNNQQSRVNFPNGIVVAKPLNFQIQRQDICEVVARPLNFQIQRQDICEGKISYKRQPREPIVIKTVPNNTITVKPLFVKRTFPKRDSDKDQWRQKQLQAATAMKPLKPQNADKTPREQGSWIEAQSDGANQLDVVILNAENNEACGEEDSNAQFLPKEVDDTTTDVVLCVESASVIQEIDVVVHPSILQPTEKSKNIKKIGKQQGVGVEKRRKSKPRECKECGKILASTTTYLEHMNIHYDRRPYKCGECSKSFRQRYHIDQHKIVHTGNKPFVCQDCDRAFAKSYNLRDHQRIHTGEKPCKCGHCDKTFRLRRGLREHETNVLRLLSPRNELGTLKEIKVYSCKICVKT